MQVSASKQKARKKRKKERKNEMDFSMLTNFRPVVSTGVLTTPASIPKVLPNLVANPFHVPFHDGCIETKANTQAMLVIRKIIKPDVQQAAMATNAMSIKNHHLVRKTLALKHGTDFPIECQDNTYTHLQVHDLAFVYADTIEGVNDDTGGIDSIRSSVAVFSAFNHLPRGIPIKFAGVVDTPDDGMGIPNDVTLTTHGVRTISNTGTHHIRPMMDLIWLPPLVQKDPFGNKMMPIFSYESHRDGMLLQARIAPLDWRKSDFAFHRQWLRDCTKGEDTTIPSDGLREHPSYPNCKDLIKLLVESDFAGKLNAVRNQTTFLEAAALLRPESKSTKDIVEFNNTIRKMHEIAVKENPHMTQPQQYQTALWRYLTFRISEQVMSHVNVIMGHRIGKALDPAEPGQFLRIVVNG